MKRIDDNTLAAYLEGSLPQEEREWVEQTIEDDNELKAVVDEWISMADDFALEQMPKDNNTLQMEACKTIGKVMEQINRPPYGYRKAAGAEYSPQHAAMPAMKEERKTRPNRHWPTYRRIIVAASLLAFVSVSGIWLFKSPEEGLMSSPTFDVQKGNYNCNTTGNDTVSTEQNPNNQTETYRNIALPN